MQKAISQRGNAPDVEHAANNLARLMEHVASLYCMDGSSSISALEAHELTLSVLYVLGIANATPEEAALVLDITDPILLWHDGIARLRKRVGGILSTWREILAIMPPIRNVALRDTLASLGNIEQRYDICFAAHEVPCDIDYQLSQPVDTSLIGLDYIEAWLSQLLAETRWLAQFESSSCIAVLERVCPDYRGLNVNLCDLLVMNQNELVRR